MAIHYQILGAPGHDNAVYVQIGRGQRIHRLLFDCGEVGLNTLPLSDLRSVDHLLLSHLHMDHISGFDAFFRQNFNRAEPPPQVWGPPETARIIHHRLQGFLWNLHEQLDGLWLVHDVGPASVASTRFLAREAFALAHPAGELSHAEPIIATADYRVEAIQLDHTTPSLGFLVRERPRRNIDLGRLAALGLPTGPWLRALKEPRPDEPPRIELAGQMHELATLRAELLSETPGGSLAYLTDFRLDEPTLAELRTRLHNCETLICESQYRAADAELAARVAHLTAPQAARIAVAANVGALILFHISERYNRDELPGLLAEAQTIFPNTRLPSGWM